MSSNIGVQKMEEYYSELDGYEIKEFNTWISK